MNIIQVIKGLLAPENNEKLSDVEKDFDILMKEVQADSEDLERLAEHIEDEFDDLDIEVQVIQKGVDEIVGDER
ncbi:MAG: hypothetical protein V1880_03450 [Patescibacteria group bacterium]